MIKNNQKTMLSKCLRPVFQIGATNKVLGSPVINRNTRYESRNNVSQTHFLMIMIQNDLHCNFATLQVSKIFFYLQAIASNDNSSRIDKNRLFSTTTCLEKPVFCSTADEAVKDIPSGSKLLVGGKEVKTHLMSLA